MAKKRVADVLVIGIVFITSGWKHLQDPEARSKDIEMSIISQ